MRRIAMAIRPARGGCALGACGGGGATKSTTTRRHQQRRHGRQPHPGDRSRCGTGSRSASSAWSSRPWPRSTRRTRGSRSRSSAASTTTRSSRRSAGATRPTSRSPSPPTTPAASARRAAGSTSGPTWTRDKIDASSSRRRCRATRSTSGKRCAMPMLADIYGLYYNKELLHEGRDHRAAEDDVRAHGRRQEAHRARRRQRSRSSASTRPRASTRTPPPTTAPVFGAQVGRRPTASRSSPATRLGRVPELAEGPRRLLRLRQARRLQAGAGDEFSASNAFERGKLAMTIDGEYRTAFIKAEHPDLNYATAPMPVGRQPARRSTARATSPATSSGSPRAPSTRTRPGSWSSTWRPTSMRSRCCPTG